MLDAAPFQHGFQNVPFLRSTVNPYSTYTASTRPANQHWLCFGCPSAATLATISWRLQPPGRQRQVIQVVREAAARQPPPRSRRRVLSCQHPPERINHAQPSAASLKPNHAIGVGPGLGHSFRRRRPPHCAERRVPIRGVGLASELTARSANTTETMLAGDSKTARMVAHYDAAATAEQGVAAKHL